MLQDILGYRQTAEGDSCCRRQLPLSSYGKQSPATMAISWAASHMLTLLWQWRATESSLWVYHTMSKQPHPFMRAFGNTLNLLHIHTMTAAACIGLDPLLPICGVRPGGGVEWMA